MIVTVQHVASLSHLAGIVVTNPTRGMGVSRVSFVCCHVEVSALG